MLRVIVWACVLDDPPANSAILNLDWQNLLRAGHYAADVWEKSQFRMAQFEGGRSVALRMIQSSAVSEMMRVISRLWQ